MTLKTMSLLLIHHRHNYIQGLRHRRGWADIGGHGLFDWLERSSCSEEDSMDPPSSSPPPLTQLLCTESQSINLA